MLQELSIRNFAIIDDLHICFSEGLTILSGETGAGKSIIINAVNLLLGSRATAKLIRTGAETAELEALFQVASTSGVARTMEQHDYDASQGLVIRRIISRKDRHRIYINGRMATIQLLNLITENLASISGQHAHQRLLKEDQHLMILDQFGNLMSLRAEVYQCFQGLLPLLRKLKDLIAGRDRQAEHIELLEFQKKEIVAVSVTLGEDARLENERMRLKNSELLYQSVYESVEELYSSPGAIVERLVAVKKNLDKASQIDTMLAGKVEKVAESAFQVEEVVEELRTYLSGIEIDEHRLEAVEARLDTLQRLKRKYGGSLETVISHLASIDLELSEIANHSDKITAIEAEIAEKHRRLVELAQALSRKRRQVAEVLAQKVEDELATLKMSQTEFKISLQTQPADESADPHLAAEGHTIFETGIDRASFLIAPNVGEALKPLASIASGGELSRVVLALKAILAETGSVETIVFDEVDAGIGGGVAEFVGRKLSALAAYHQIICITHLPQIAKFGHHHFRISKQVSGGRTRTSLKPLSAEERVGEIARMLGGEKITQATIDHAREMIESA